jgi:hypothetical protein
MHVARNNHIDASMTSTLPQCRFRGPEVSVERWFCGNHTCLTSLEAGVSPDDCRRCEFADRGCGHGGTAFQRPPEIGAKPGSLLKWLIWKATGDVPTGNCACAKRAAEMDAWGWVGCWWHREEIYGWLAEEAEKRGKHVDRAAFWPLLKAGFREWRGKRPTPPAPPA